MAELSSLTSPPHKMGSSPPPPSTQQKPYQPIAYLLSKAAFFLVFAALLPLFPSQAPEFLNHTLLTRSWELLHLLLVGIAVSYGLFSHRNADPSAEKEVLHKADSPQSYLAQLLQVSPVFDDEEPETPSGPDESKLQMWNSRCHRGEPTVVVAPESPGDAGNSSVGSRLVLPVRSLRSSIPDVESRGKKNEDETPLFADLGSRSFCRRRAEDMKAEQAASLDPPVQKEELAGEGISVLPSPIPWRSRTGRMEAKDETSTAATPLSQSLPLPNAESETSTFRSVSFLSPPSRSTSATPSPRRLSPSPSVSPEPRARAGEDPGKKSTLFKPAPIPPPPPPPPPAFIHKPPNPPPPEEKEACSSFRDEPKNSSARITIGRREDDRGWSGDLGSPRYSRHHNRPTSPGEGAYYSVGRSVRTVRPRKVLLGATADGATLVRAASEKKKENKKNGVEDDEGVTASDDTHSDDGGEASDVDVGYLPRAAAAGADVEEEEEEENEVDKKADEFIAKFREQIRQQRIETIKKTAGPQAVKKR